MTDDRDSLTEDEARHLWLKAAQLQAEAARLAEAQATVEAARGLDGELSAPADGYALVHVRAAALEAGIAGEFVDAALAEVRARRAMEEAAPSRRGRLARWILGHPPDALEARRVVRAGPVDVLRAMEAVLPGEPYTLLLRARHGDPLEGGTLVFDLQGVGFTTGGQPGFKGDASFADLRQVYATLTSLPGPPPRTELVLRSPVAWARGLNAGVSGGLSLLGGGVGLGVGAAVVSGLAVLAPLVAGIVAATGGGAGAVLTLKGFRALHRHGLGRGVRALEGMAASVAAHAEGGWGISLPPG